MIFIHIICIRIFGWYHVLLQNWIVHCFQFFLFMIITSFVLLILWWFSERFILHTITSLFLFYFLLEKRNRIYAKYDESWQQWNEKWEIVNNFHEMRLWIDFTCLIMNIHRNQSRNELTVWCVSKIYLFPYKDCSKSKNWINFNFSLSKRGDS